jgi:hypothetical protein
MNLDELLTLADAAELTGRSVASLQKAAMRGRLEARLLGTARGHGEYVTTRDAVARYVAEVEAWRSSGRQPRQRQRRDVLNEEEIAALLEMP